MQQGGKISLQHNLDLVLKPATEVVQSRIQFYSVADEDSLTVLDLRQERWLRELLLPTIWSRPMFSVSSKVFAELARAL